MGDIVSQLKEDNSNLLDLLEPYLNGIEHASEHLSLKGKTLAQVNQEQVSWQAYYDERRISLNSAVKYFQVLLEQEKGRLWKQYTEKHNRELSNPDKNHYINDNKNYILKKQLLLEVEEIYERYVSICKAYETRGYALRNLNDLYVHSLQDVTI